MLKWALIFLVIALVSGLIGFTDITVAAVGMAKVLFFIFMVLFVFAVVFALFRGRGRRR